MREEGRIALDNLVPIVSAFGAAHTRTLKRRLGFLSCTLHQRPARAICCVYMASVPGGTSPKCSMCPPLCPCQAQVCGCGGAVQ